MGEYHDLYLKSDMLLLADVSENFRKTCLQYYKLDPCHYFTSPGLSWDAMLKMTNINLFAIAFRYTGIRNVHHCVPLYRDSRHDVMFLLVACERLV